MQIPALILNNKCDLSCRFQPLPIDRVQRGYRGTLSFIFIKTFCQAPISQQSKIVTVKWTNKHQIHTQIPPGQLNFTARRSSVHLLATHHTEREHGPSRDLAKEEREEETSTNK